MVHFNLIKISLSLPDTLPTQLNVLVTTFVERNVLQGSVHAVETMDTISQVPSLPVKIYLDEIDKLGNYESILP